MACKKIIVGCSSQIGGLKDFLQEAYDTGFDIVVFGELATELIRGLSIHKRSNCGDIALIDPARVCDHFTSCTEDDVVGVTVSINPHGSRPIQDYSSQLLTKLAKSQGAMHVFLAEMQHFADFLHACEAEDLVLIAQIKQASSGELQKLLNDYRDTPLDLD